VFVRVSLLASGRPGRPVVASPFTSGDFVFSLFVAEGIQSGDDASSKQGDFMIL
jgi:hypothetical protein